MDNFEPVLKKLEATIEEKLNASMELYKASANDGGTKIKQELKDEVSALVAKYNATMEAQQKQLDELEKKAGRLTAQVQKNETFVDVTRKALETSEAFKAFKTKSSAMAAINLEYKSATTLTPQDNYTGEVVAAQRVPGIIYDPDRSVHVRQFCSVGSTNSDSIRFIQETAITDAATIGMIAPGGLKTQVEFDLKAEDAKVRKIAIFLTLAEEMIDDTEGLLSYITTRFGRFIPVKEDTQLLYGSGIGENLVGISQVAAPFFFNGTLPQFTQEYDILRFAVTQAMTQTNNGRSGYMPNVIMVSPEYMDVLSGLKDEEGRYLFPNALESGVVRVKGVPVIQSTAIEGSDYFVGDFRLGAQIFDRNQQSVRFSYENKDNVEKNLVTVVMEKRLAFPIYRPSAFVYSNFEADLANYSSGS
jgi:HK97 family phage major capsid protein